MIASTTSLRALVFDAYGTLFDTFWVGRSRAPLDDLGAAPDHVIATLAELPALVMRGQ